MSACRRFCFVVHIIVVVYIVVVSRSNIIVVVNILIVVNVRVIIVNILSSYCTSVLLRS